MKAIPAIAAATAAILAAMPVSAGEGHARHRAGLLARADLNGDGAIGRDELRAQREVRFLRWDRDGDGAATESEMLAAAQERLARRMGKVFARMDRNGDGRIELAELDRLDGARFERMDTDGDGRVTIAELRARWRDRWHGHDDEARTAD